MNNIIVEKGILGRGKEMCLCMYFFACTGRSNGVSVSVCVGENDVGW